MVDGAPVEISSRTAISDRTLQLKDNEGSVTYEFQIDRRPRMRGSNSVARWALFGAELYTHEFS